MNCLKILTLALLGFYALNVIAEQSYIEPPMIIIPAGKFTMGSNTGQPTKIPHIPERHVTIKSFQLSKLEVTVQEFRKFVEATKYETGAECWTRKMGTAEAEVRAGNWSSPGYAPSELHPVMCVSPKDAKAYIAWLNQQTGKQYRLPSEAEWEYAARAGSKDDYFFGNDEKDLCEYANVFDQSGARAFKRDLGVEWAGIYCDDSAEYTSVVGTYKPNAFGLYDMIGNVGEYVEDCEHANYEGAPSDGSAWIVDCPRQEYLFGLIKVDKKFIHRGSNYGADGTWSRIFIRGHAGEFNPSSLGEGFRLALDVD